MSGTQPHNPAHNGDGDVLGTYLWDGSGSADPLALRLEKALRPLAHRGRWEEVTSRMMRRSLRPLAIAASVSIISALVLWAVMAGRTSGPSHTGTTWRVASIGPGVKLDQPESIKRTFTSRRLETTADASATLACGAATSVTVQGGSVVRIIDADPQWPWLEVERGSLTVHVGAADRPVGIETMDRHVDIKPGAIAMLSADAMAGGLVTMKSGECEVKRGDDSVRVPETYGCSVGGPTTVTMPIRFDASKELTGALATLESMLGSKATGKARAAAIYRVLERARPEDGATLWNLLPRLSPDERLLISEHLVKAQGDAKLSPDIKAIVDLDPAALDALWKVVTAAPSQSARPPRK